MTRPFSFLTLILALTIMSCSSSLDLVTKVTVLDHSSCEPSAAALIKLEATGGATPYVYTLWDVANDEMIVSEKTDEGVVMVGKKDLRSVDYRFILTDYDGNKIEEDFQVKPEGSSEISSQLTMENEDISFTPENIEIQLIKLGSETVLETVYTDDQGRYTFTDLAAGNYTLEVMLHDKYDDFLLMPKNPDTRIRIEHGSHITRPFTLACNENFEADLLMTN